MPLYWKYCGKGASKKLSLPHANWLCLHVRVRSDCAMANASLRDSVWLKMSSGKIVAKTCGLDN
eukprot:1425899-Amphidinium_carterae.1